MGLARRSENCCCCIGVKAGTLILLYLDLFAVILAIIVAYSGTRIGGYTSVFFGNYLTMCTTSGGLCLSFIIGGVVLLIIIVAGLFAIAKKKPMLLIPYFSIRILVVIAVIVIVAKCLFFQNEVFDFLETWKSHCKVISYFIGDDLNLLVKIPNAAMNLKYVLIVVEVILIILQIHYAKVVYACYKKIEEEMTGNQGIMYGASQISTLCSVTTTILQSSSKPRTSSYLLGFDVNFFKNSKLLVFKKAQNIMNISKIPICRKN